MILIYDVNGFIAGMHSVVMKKFSTDNWQSGSKWYRLDNLFGEEAYLSTAYFVDPASICTGRTQDQFDSEGTGNRLLFQNGPSTSDTIAAPLDLDQADSSVRLFTLRKKASFVVKCIYCNVGFLVQAFLLLEHG